MKMRFVFLLALIIGSGLPAQDAERTLSTGAPPPPFFRNFNWTNFFYKTVNGKELEIVLFPPAVKKYDRAPFMVYFHGGGWQNGNHGGIFNWPSMQRFLNEGIACASVQYRLIGSGAETADDCVTDCKDGVRFLVKNAEQFELNPQSIGTWGHSAGGHLCLMVALAPDELFPGDPSLAGTVPQFRCIVPSAAPVSFVAPEVISFEKQNRVRLERLLSKADGDVEAAARRQSPAEYFTAGAPAVLFIHGDKDEAVNVINAIYGQEKAAAAGMEAQMLIVTNGTHMLKEQGGALSPVLEEVYRRTADFIIEKLNPEK